MQISLVIHLQMQDQLTMPFKKENILKVNEINDADKDLPKTGETDMYIVAGIAVITIAVGAFAFIKSKKYNV